MSEYHKIETMFERNEDFTVDTDRLRKPVLATISEWDVTEKIDGTNIRVIFEGGIVRFGGKTDRAQIHADLVHYLYETFTPEKLQRAFTTDPDLPPPSVVLYGEGYGAGIQKGGAYRADKSFILFDVLVAGKWWLDDANMRDVAWRLGIDAVPYLGRMSFDEIVTKVRNGFVSRIGTARAEGVVARPIETLFDKKGERLIVKLKESDFRPGKR